MNQLAILPPVPAPAGAGPAPTASAPLVIALDLALGTTGVAGLGWTDYLTSGQRRAEERLDYVLHRAQSFYRLADFVVIEGPAFSRATQVGHDEMAALRWMVRTDLWKRRIPCAVVPPDNRTIFATGKARHRDAETRRSLTPVQVKGLVRQAVADQYGIECDGRAKYDQADAYVLLAMGLHHLGHPQAALPDTHTRALAGVNWPERTDS
ncbi:hypothetical protein [Kitasatospora sp. NPDC004289]